MQAVEGRGREGRSFRPPLVPSLRPLAWERTEQAEECLHARFPRGFNASHDALGEGYDGHHGSLLEALAPGDHPGALDELIAGGAAMQQAMREARRLADIDETSVIVGPGSGTGKRTFARAIHRASRRGGGPLVELGPQAIPDSLFDQQVYGDAGHHGAFQAAAGGTLVLWYAELCSAWARPRLLEVLRTGCLDGAAGRPHQARVLVTIGLLGEWPDLEQLSVPRLTLPLLSAREDLAELAQHILGHYVRHSPRPTAFLTDEALRAIEACRWLGGVRDMQTSLVRALHNADSDALGPDDLCLPGG